MREMRNPRSGKLPGEESNDLLHLVGVLYRRFWMVLLAAVVGGGIGLLYNRFTRPIYRSNVGVQVEQQEQKIINIDSVSRQDLSQLEVLKTIEQSFRSRAVMDAVAEAAGLDSVPDFIPDQPVPVRRETTVDFLLDRSGSALRHGTRLIDITFDHEDPPMARKVVEAIVEQSIRLGFEQSRTAAEAASLFLVAEVENLRRKLEKSEMALQAYRERAGSIAFEERQGMVVEKLRQINAVLTGVGAERLRLEADCRQVDAAGDDPFKLLSIPGIGQASGVLGRREAHFAAEAEIAMLAERYTEQHPRMIQARRRQEESRRSLVGSVAEAAAGLRNQLAATREREEGLVHALLEQEKMAVDISRQAIQYGVLNRDVESDQALYQAVLTRFKETKLTMEMRPVAFRVVEPATPPTIVRPKRFQVVILAVFIGALAGGGLVLALHWFDSTVRTVDEAERALGLPVLGAVPSGPRAKRIPVLLDPGSPAAEAFRTLRANLVLCPSSASAGTLAVTSAEPGEGKTFTAVNLAIALAQAGARTLLIDGDLRRPGVAQLLYPDAPEHLGLADVLGGTVRLDAVIRPTAVSGLSCITDGRRRQGRQDLMTGQAFPDFLREAALGFDRVVIDTVPVHAASDTLSLGRHVGAVVLVVRAGGPARKSVQRAITVLERAGMVISGVVLNRLPRNAGAGSYYHYGRSKPYGAVEISRVPGAASGSLT